MANPGRVRTEGWARAKPAMDKDLAVAWADRTPGLMLSSPRDALILASIVERETAKPEERPHVAAAYLNRLRQGMRLQAAPTVVYLASNGAGVLDHRLTRAELGRDDPFNTYRSAGLPPAPICSPSLDSVRAVLHPATICSLSRTGRAGMCSRARMTRTTPRWPAGEHWFLQRRTEVRTRSIGPSRYSIRILLGQVENVLTRLPIG
jgi:hypothetical protein